MSSTLIIFYENIFYYFLINDIYLKDNYIISLIRMELIKRLTHINLVGEKIIKWKEKDYESQYFYGYYWQNNTNS